MRAKFYFSLSKLIAFLVVAISVPTFVNGQAPASNFTGTPLSGCSPLIVIFQDLSTGNPTSWNWSFGNGNTSTIQNPTATYFTPGTYTVTLTTTNTSGSNTLTRTAYITVYDNPVINFSSSAVTGCFPFRPQFTDLTNPGIGNTAVAWEWDFGNGATSTLQNPQAVYTTAGTYNVTLKVTNDKGCVKTLSRPNYISVTTGVVASFTNTQPLVCSAPAPVTFTNTSTGPATLSYIWDFGDGSPKDFTLSPSHIFNASGTFTVMLVTNSTFGCEDTARAIITVGGYNPSFTGPPSICVNKPATFLNTSVPLPANSTWNFGDLSPVVTSLNATHTFLTAGTYRVKMYNNNGSCTDSAFQDIIVIPEPVANFSAPVTAKCQPPLTVNFQDLSTGGAVSWEWDFGDGSPLDITQNPTHTYTAFGSYDVKLIVTNVDGCKDTLSKPAFVKVLKPIIAIPGLPTRGCIPFTISPVAVITTIDAVTSYAWDFGDGTPIDNNPNPTHTYPVQGTYTVTLTITTSTGCTEIFTVGAAVKVGSKPVANFSATPNPVCALQPIQFTDLSTAATPGGGVDEWLWNFGDGQTSTLQNPTHIYSSTGFFTVTLTATNNGCPDSKTVANFVEVRPPIALFTPVPDCINRLQFNFTNQSITDPAFPPITWLWDFGDGQTSTAQIPPTHLYPGLGNYTVTLTVNNGTAPTACSNTITHIIRLIDENPDFIADKTIDCKISTINFTATGIAPANVQGYTWNFGDGSPLVTVPGINVPHTYLVSNKYTVTLTTTDLNGCTDVITKNNYITINGPTSNFSATNTDGCTNIVTTFSDLSVANNGNAITNWQFDFGDGTIQNFTSFPVTHKYAITGTYAVKLVVTDATGCKDSLTINNLIHATDPVPNFISADTLTCPNSTVNFTNTSTPAGVTSSWFFGDGGTSFATSPSHVYTATGLYNVKLVIGDPYGCLDSITKFDYIRVDTPHAAFTVSDSISSCTPLEVQFTNTSTYYKTALWNFGAGQGSSTLPNPVHFYSLPGSYVVTLSITSPGGCVDSYTKTITVYDTAGTRLNYTPNGGCKPLDVNLSVLTPGVIKSYYWDFGDGITQTTLTPTNNHIYASFGNFLPKIIMEDPSGCLIPIPGIDTVYVTGATANFGNDDSLFCDFGLVKFTDSTTFNDPVLSYNWDFGDGGTDIAQNPAHLYTAPGNYTVRLAIQTQLGCVDTLTKTNIVKVVQRPLIDITGDSIVCVNSSLLNSGIFLQPDTSVVTWQWTFPNGNIVNNQNPPPQIYTQAGSFTVTAIATNSTGCKDTTTQSLLVNPLPTVTMPSTLVMQVGVPVIIPATYSAGVFNWIWSNPVGLSCTDCPTPEANPKFTTFYQVSFGDQNGCRNIGSITVQVLCQNSNLFIPNTFSPNNDGSNDRFYPRGFGIDRVKFLRVFNRWGEIVYEKRDFAINDAASGWDGTYKGKKAQADVYIYQAEVFCQNGEIIKLNGNIALLQ